MKNLYRRYRPLKLSDVVGQSQVTDSLTAALKSGKVGHAYLFIGPRGCGKTSVARILAHEVNGFKYQLEDEYVDIVEIDGASNRGIDDIRELREKAAIAPTTGKYKVYIIDEVHMLTKEAFNALLKTLEEPPAHVIFIMATTDAHKVPVTITSRAQTYTFKLADAATMSEFLRKVADTEKLKITDDALAVIAKRGGGSFRDSLSLLDQISTLSDQEITREIVVAAMGLPEDEKIAKMLDTYASGDVVKITTLLKDLLASGIKAETLAEGIISAIIDDPRPELLPLLAKLPEVKEPFAEARLLVALAGAPRVKASKPISSSAGLEFSGTSYAGRPGEPSSSKTNLSASSGIYVPKNSNHSMPQKKQVLDAPDVSDQNVDLANEMPKKGVSDRTRDAEISDRARDVKTSSSVAFDWNGLLGRMQGVSEVLYKQLTKCEHEVRGGVLHVYPRTKIIKNIIDKPNNKKIIVEQAAGTKVEIHEAGEHPESAEKDATLAEISAIMGGEVIDDGGGKDLF